MEKTPDSYDRILVSPRLISVDPSSATHAIYTLNRRAKGIINFMPWRARSALKLLSSAIEPYTDVHNLEHIYQIENPTQMDDAPTPAITLLGIFEQLLTTNNFASDYNEDAQFYTQTNNVLERLPPECQAVISTTLNNILGIQFYLDDLAEYWYTALTQSQQTNIEYLASCFAAQLQLIGTLSMDDKSLPLSGVALISPLLSDAELPNSYLYHLAVTSAAHGDLPLAGAFVIMRHPAHTPLEENPCVLYIPGDNLKYFDNPDLLKTLVCAGFNTPLKNKLLSCIIKIQHSSVNHLIKQGLTKDRIVLNPVQFSPRFFYDQTLQLINLHQQNIRYLWATAPAGGKQKKHWPEHLISNINAELESWVTFSKPYISINDSIEPTRSLPALPPTKKADLKPIRIHVYVHNDLAGKYDNASLLNDYFSWAQTELKDITHREVHINIVPPDRAKILKKYHYKNTSETDSIAGWKTLATDYLKTNFHKLSPLEIHLLLTHEDINTSVSGIAENIGGQFAIASTTRYRVAAHEIGHLLGATHKNGAVIYNGWWHNTLMKTPDFFFTLRGQAYRFSDENREAISHYLKRFD